MLFCTFLFVCLFYCKCHKSETEDGRSLADAKYRFNCNHNPVFQSYVSCTLGFQNIGPILICFGAASAVSSISIGYVARHIKRFAFIAAGATFNAGLLIVLALWQPKPHDIPNFYVVAGCLGLCDAIWQTQTYSQ